MRLINAQSREKHGDTAVFFSALTCLDDPHDLLPQQDVLFINGFVVVVVAEQPVVVSCSFLDRELDAIRAAGEGGTVAHVLPEDELPMNATGLETLDNI